MNQRSAKNKGNRFEQYLVDQLRESVDVNTHKTNASGAGIDKNDVRIPALNIELEAKNADGFSLMGDWEQTKAQKTTGNMSMLAIRHPRKAEFVETLIVMEFNDFITLCQGQQKEREVSYTANKGDKWVIQNAIQAMKRLLKIYETT